MFLFISKPDFACNPHALWKYITEKTGEETAWLVSDPKHMETLRARGILCELYDTVRGNELAARADYVISNVYVFGDLPKREGQIFVNLWHGSGIKAHDFYDPALHPQQLRKVLKFSEETDLMCVHSLDDRFRLSAQLHFDMRKAVVTGQPRLDCVKTSAGRDRLAKALGRTLDEYERILFYVPSFRANSSSHSGRFYSDNVFRLEDFSDEGLCSLLETYHAALVYKLHPVEQTALRGVAFSMNPHCFELTDEMLFQADVRYDELLNAFDMMISDYSSIVYDFLLLDRPVVYLIADYEEYRRAKGFVFHNIDYYMPGAKAYCFGELLEAVREGFEEPGKYAQARRNVIEQRFDYDDDRACERCYQAIMQYRPPVGDACEVPPRRLLPDSAELLAKYLPETIQVIDAAVDTSRTVRRRDGSRAFYITEELPDAYRSLSKRAASDVLDLSFYEKVKNDSSVTIALVSGGVEYWHFAAAQEKSDTNAATEAEASTVTNTRKRIGFAGTIDCRIYFAMVQYLCEAFPDCDIVFAGDIFGEFPAWLCGYDNLHYTGPVPYDKLPDMIMTFDVALLPFYGKYRQRVPNELFQYLACGKPVVTSDMPDLPDCAAIYRSRSVADAVSKMKTAFMHCGDEAVTDAARKTAARHDWSLIAEELLKTYKVGE